MSPDTSELAATLNRYFLLNFPAEAARQIESFAIADIVPSLREQPAEVLVPVWSKLVPLVAATLTRQLPDSVAQKLLTDIPPGDAVRILFQLPQGQRNELLQNLSAATRSELTELMSYPEDAAGRLMDTRIPTYHGNMTVSDALDSLRRAKMKTARSLYLVDVEGRICARVLLQDLALVDPDSLLEELAKPVRATVQATASREEVLDTFAKYILLDLPVVDLNGVLLGVIINNSLVQAVQEETSADIQTMVGVSREERALSSPFFAVKKRMPWLQINLLTAFLAAAVVGLFEHTIAQVTALAILLPVVAGQSGNSGAQALAVTMRGLALREITVRHWFTVMFKEVRVGFLNGVAIATTCGAGVYVWSQSWGLVAVICSAMVLAMVAAGFAGAVVPIVLVRMGQDPAQSSSIILTTVTDVTGFFAFLGIATLMMGYL